MIYKNIIGHIVDGVLGYSAQDIHSIEQLHGGLTNSSYLVEVADKKYVFRLPGKDTEKIINRKHEKVALELAKQLGIDPTYVAMNTNHGWKISAYEEGCRMPDYQNFEDSKKVIAKMKELHEKKAHVDWNFEPWYDAVKLEQLIHNWKEFDLSLRDKVFKIFKTVEHDRLTEKCFCHCDTYAPNFLIKGNTVIMLDWEYAGEADPAVDIAYYIVDAMYDTEAAEKFIDQYLGKHNSPEMMQHFLAYIPVVAYYWYIWALFREQSGAVLSHAKRVWYKMAGKYADYYLEKYES